MFRPLVTRLAEELKQSVQPKPTLAGANAVARLREAVQARRQLAEDARTVQAPTADTRRNALQQRRQNRADMTAPLMTRARAFASPEGQAGLQRMIGVGIEAASYNPREAAIQQRMQAGNTGRRPITRELAISRLDDTRTPLDVPGARRAIDIALTKIPYRDQAVGALQTALDTGMALNPATAPGKVILDEAGKRLPFVPTGKGVSDTAIDLAVPREVWELALEFVPGVGTIPDLQRAVRKGAPEAVAATRRALADPRAAEAVARARTLLEGGESGVLNLPGGDEMRRLRAEMTRVDKKAGSLVDDEAKAMGPDRWIAETPNGQEYQRLRARSLEITNRLSELEHGQNVAREAASTIADEPRIGDWIVHQPTDNAGFGTRGRIVGEGMLGKDVPAWKIDVGGGKISAVPKARTTLWHRAESAADDLVPPSEAASPPEQPRIDSGDAPGERSLPAELRGAKPRYNIGANSFMPTFTSDVDKALFIVAQKTPSRADAKYMDFLREVFPASDDAEIRAAGADVRAEIKRVAMGAQPGAITVEPVAAARARLVTSPTPGEGASASLPMQPAEAGSVPPPVASRVQRAGVRAPKQTAFDATREEIAHFENLIATGDWTETKGSRIGAQSTLNMLKRGEVPSDKQLGMLQRALASTPPASKAAPAPRKPRTRVGGGEPPIEPPTPPVATGAPREPLPPAPTQGYQQTMDVGAMRLADGMRQSTLADIAGSRNVVQRFQDFFEGVIGAPKFIANNKKDLAAAVIQVPRTLKTAIDIGWGGRNGWRLFPMHMAAWTRMYGRQYTTLASEDAYRALQAQTAALPQFRRLHDAGLAFLERGTGDIEKTGEEVMSRFTQNLPILNRTERAYIAPGNAMRYEIANDFITQWEKRNGVPLPDAEVKKLVDHYNAATLRGNTRYLAKAHAEVLGSILFSTKGLVSGPQYVAGGVKALLDPRMDAAVRQEIAGDVAAYIAAGMGTLGLIGVTGAGVVDINRNSPTFGQVKVGPVRWNYWGADQSMVRQILMQMPGGGKREIEGQTEDRSRLQEGLNFAGNKLAPGLPRTAWDAAVNRGRTFEGNELDTPGGFAMNLANQFKPIPAETAMEANKNAGAIAAIVSMLADLNGFTTSTYELTPRVDPLKYKANEYIEKSPYDDVPDRAVKYLAEQRGWEYDSYDEFLEALTTTATAKGGRVEDTVIYKDVQSTIATGRLRLREKDPRLDAYIVLIEGAKPRTAAAAAIVFEEQGIRVPVAER